MATTRAVDTYYAQLEQYHKLGVVNELSVREAFKTLLDERGRTLGWTLLVEKGHSRRARPDATFVDDYKLPRGHWEAKDTRDDLETEIRAKIGRGYPLKNTIFEDTRRGVLYQDGRRVLDVDLTQRPALTGLLDAFFGYSESQVEEFHAAVGVFQDQIPELAEAMEKLIAEERGRNPRFVLAFDRFYDLCKTALNPNLSARAIEEMLVQHLLTERLFRTVFDNPDFTRRNVIAAEIEAVIDALTSRSFSRQAYLKRLDHFYLAIENTARTIGDYSEKQAFLNTVYERFFQGFSRKQADTHGVVYTPQPIVDFMVASVDEVLKREFGQSLSSEGVVILDPATGTGNFIVNILNRLQRRDIRRKYAGELFCNEIMLLPYYVAGLNIEHAFYEATGEYAPFEGVCFVDTLDLTEGKQYDLFTPRNTERVSRETNAEITVIIGNPPYNVGQQNEMDNNKNRKYKEVDDRVKQTYAKDSRATNKNALADVYVKFFRWATDRLKGRDGVVCYVSNNGFFNGIAFDGMRKHLAQDFDQIYHFDFKGNARTSGDRRRDEGGNLFNDQIRVGVGITILVRARGTAKRCIWYHAVGDGWTSQQKLDYLKSFQHIGEAPWQSVQIDSKNNWLLQDSRHDFASLLPIGTKETKSARSKDVKAIFKNYGRGVATSRDEWVYDFDRANLIKEISHFIENYNAEVDRWKRLIDKNSSVDNFVTSDETRLKWTRDLKVDLQRGRYAEFSERKIRRSMYRPFCKQFLFFDRILNEEVYILPQVLPTVESERENRVIVVTDIAFRSPFSVLAVNVIPNLHLCATSDAFQCFPFYTYDEDGGNRQENITDWALGQFRAQYGDGVSKWDIFHYVYAVLHHPAYRDRYRENLKRELPRIPLVADEAAFRALVAAGARLADLHVNYEGAKEYPLEWDENRAVPFSWRVTRMKLTPDKRGVVVNDSLTLRGVPAEAFEYRLGNRSALEWVIDQYQVTTDRRSGLTSDPNQADDPEYIARLVGKVVTVSVATVEVVRALPALGVGEEGT